MILSGTKIQSKKQEMCKNDTVDNKNKGMYVLW